ncbi:MAG: hypothetical protein AB8B71_05040 [Paracoccaceae bacterium]
MKHLLVLGAVGLVLVGCARPDRIAFDGEFFRSSVKKVDGSRAEFLVSSSPFSASPSGALDAARYEATRHCIKNFGNSKILWVTSPDNDPESYDVSNDTLVLQGSCEE